MSHSVKIAKILFASNELFGEKSSRVFVDLWQEGQPTPESSEAEIIPDPQVLILYDRWREAYRNYYVSLSLRTIQPKETSSYSRSGDRRQLAQLRREVELHAEALVDAFNDWLGEQASFRDSVQNWLSARFYQEDEIRIAIASDDPNIRSLPWPAWKLLEQFERAELSIGDNRHDLPRQSDTRLPQQGLRLLAVFGYETGGNFDRDRDIIAALPNVQVEFLVRPTLAEFRAKLRLANWDILYFGGHSSSNTLASTGVLFLDSERPIPIAELKEALRTAIQQGGLQLGIFNTYDGLGLTSELEDVHFPLSIVMREPVPNDVAQRFLTYFLTAYSNGQPLYLAHREARFLLEDNSDQIPYISWLPAIAHALSSNQQLWTGNNTQTEGDPSDRQPAPSSPTLRAVGTAQTKQQAIPPTRLATNLQDMRPGTILQGKYQILHQLGRGGFAITYLAKMRQFPGQPHCVLKQLKPQAPSNMAKAQELFEREAEILFKLGSSSDRIPAVHDWFQRGEEFFLVQEYIAGTVLTQELQECGQLQARQTLQLLKQILEALQVLHQHNVIHRDIKPCNLIRRQSDNTIVLIDFGAAGFAMTEGPNSFNSGGPATIIGSANFIAPEQMRGYPELASDIYAVGILGQQAMGLQPQAVVPSAKTASSKISQQVQALLERMTRVNSKERYAHATEALQAIRAITKPVPVSPPTPTPPSPGNPRNSKILALAILGIVGVLAAIAAIGWAVLRSRPQDPEPPVIPDPPVTSPPDPLPTVTPSVETPPPSPIPTPVPTPQPPPSPIPTPVPTPQPPTPPAPRPAPPVPAPRPRPQPPQRPAPRPAPESLCPGPLCQEERSRAPQSNPSTPEGDDSLCPGPLCRQQ